MHPWFKRKVVIGLFIYHSRWSQSDKTVESVSHQFCRSSVRLISAFASWKITRTRIQRKEVHENCPHVVSKTCGRTSNCRFRTTLPMQWDREAKPYPGTIPGNQLQSLLAQLCFVPAEHASKILCFRRKVFSLKKCLRIKEILMQTGFHKHDSFSSSRCQKRPTILQCCRKSKTWANCRTNTKWDHTTDLVICPKTQPQMYHLRSHRHDFLLQTDLHFPASEAVSVLRLADVFHLTTPNTLHHEDCKWMKDTDAKSRQIHLQIYCYAWHQDRFPLP